MRFSRRNWAKFFDGSSKTTTIRLRPSPIGHKNAWAGGYSYPEFLGEFDIVSVTKTKFFMLSLDDAIADGFSSVKELQDELRRLNYYEIKDDTDVYIHKIENPVSKDELVKDGN